MTDRDLLIQDAVLIFFGDQQPTDSATDRELMAAITGCVDAFIEAAGDDLDEGKVVDHLKELRASAWNKLLEETLMRVERLKLAQQTEGLGGQG
jgi:hypothetical protein